MAFGNRTLKFDTLALANPVASVSIAQQEVSASNLNLDPVVIKTGTLDIIGSNNPDNGNFDLINPADEFGDLVVDVYDNPSDTESPLDESPTDDSGEVEEPLADVQPETETETEQTEPENQPEEDAKTNISGGTTEIGFPAWFENSLKKGGMIAGLGVLGFIGYKVADATGVIDKIMEKKPAAKPTQKKDEMKAETFDSEGMPFGVHVKNHKTTSTVFYRRKPFRRFRGSRHKEKAESYAQFMEKKIKSNPNRFSYFAEEEDDEYDGMMRKEVRLRIDEEGTQFTPTWAIEKKIPILYHYDDNSSELGEVVGDIGDVAEQYAIDHNEDYRDISVYGGRLPSWLSAETFDADSKCDRLWDCKTCERCKSHCGCGNYKKLRRTNMRKMYGKNIFTPDTRCGFDAESLGAESFEADGGIQVAEGYNDWWDELDTIRNEYPPDKFFNRRLGNPKWEDVILEQLYKDGWTPRQALYTWKFYTGQAFAFKAKPDERKMELYEYKLKPQKCGNCGEIGHNRRSCSATRNDPDFDLEKADRDNDGEISDWERAVGNAVAKGIREHKDRKEAESFEAYDPMMQNRIDRNECSHRYDDAKDAWVLKYADLNEIGGGLSYIEAGVKCGICGQERVGSWGINEREGFQITKGEEGRMPRFYGFYGAETFEAPYGRMPDWRRGKRQWNENHLVWASDSKAVREAIKTAFPEQKFSVRIVNGQYIEVVAKGGERPRFMESFKSDVKRVAMEALGEIYKDSPEELREKNVDVQAYERDFEAETFGAESYETIKSRLDRIPNYQKAWRREGYSLAPKYCSRHDWRVHPNQGYEMTKVNEGVAVHWLCSICGTEGISLAEKPNEVSE